MIIKTDYTRGRTDAQRFIELRFTGGAWLAVLEAGGEAWLTDPVTDQYLYGLADGGCRVVYPKRTRQYGTIAA